MRKLLIYFILIPLFACGQTNENDNAGVLFPVKEYGKWGYINASGEIVIECQFDDALQFSEGLAAVLVDTLWGFIDMTGKIVIEPQFRNELWRGFSDGLCKIFLNDNYKEAFIKTDGSIAFISHFESVSTFAFGRATAKINNEVCVIDKTGKILFNTHYPHGGGSPLQDSVVKVWGGKGGWVEEGLSLVWRGDSTRYYDINGNLLMEIEGMGHSNFNNGLAHVQINDYDCFINKKGEIVIKAENTKLSYSKFSDGLAQIYKGAPVWDHEIAFMDTSGKIVIPFKRYGYIHDFKEGLAAFNEEGGFYEGNWGFIDKTGKIAIQPQFDEVSWDGFFGGLCAVKQNHQWGYINYKGEFVWKEQVGLEYTKLDLSKWKLDTLKINEPIYAYKYAGSDNFPRKQTFDSLNQLTLKVDTVDITVYKDRYFAYKIYLINASKDTVRIPAQDGLIKIIQQAKNKRGKWQDIENFRNSWCGNSYHSIALPPNEYQIFATPIYKGEFKTQLRFKLEIGKQIIYSNTYWGEINHGQLLDEKKKNKTGISVWAF